MYLLKEPPASSWHPDLPLTTTIPGTDIVILEQIFGALSQDPDQPLSRVSVANSSFSLDPFKGCPVGCAYCTAASVSRHLSSSPNSPEQLRPASQPELLFRGQVLAEALIQHPAFIPNSSIVSIGTGSTEAFLTGVEEETWQIMETFLKHNFTNPFWIITKTGLQDALVLRWRQRIERLAGSGIPLVISISDSGAPIWAEPYTANRYKNIGNLKIAGAKISHHLRPIIGQVNDSEACIQKALAPALALADNICAGGLRRDPGIVFTWHHLHHLDLAQLPPGREKTLPEGYLDRLSAFLAQCGYQGPVFQRSSEALGHLLKIPDYNLHAYRPANDECFLTIPIKIQAEILARYNLPISRLVEQIAWETGLENIQAVQKDEALLLTRSLAYEEHRVLIHAIGHARILPPSGGPHVQSG